MNKDAVKAITHYPDINEVLSFAAKGIRNILGANLIGFYLTGSLTYDDYVEGRSDIDLFVVVNKAMSKKVTHLIKELHLNIEGYYPQWAERIECSYLPIAQLKSILPPKTPRAYMGGGRFYTEACYGNEWIINLYFLYNFGIAIIGPEFKTLGSPVNINDVRKASATDLFMEWAPKINDHLWLENSHYQSYLVLNLCRILNTLICRNVSSKTISAIWVQAEYPEWEGLVTLAMNWKHGMKMDKKVRVIEFLQFAIDRISAFRKELGLP